MIKYIRSQMKHIRGQMKHIRRHVAFRTLTLLAACVLLMLACSLVARQCAVRLIDEEYRRKTAMQTQTIAEAMRNLIEDARTALLNLEQATYSKALYYAVKGIDRYDAYETQRNLNLVKNAIYNNLSLMDSVGDIVLSIAAEEKCINFNGVYDAHVFSRLLSLAPRGEALDGRWYVNAGLCEYSFVNGDGQKLRAFTALSLTRECEGLYAVTLYIDLGALLKRGMALDQLGGVEAVLLDGENRTLLGAGTLSELEAAHDPARYERDSAALLDDLLSIRFYYALDALRAQADQINGVFLTAYSAIVLSMLALFLTMRRGLFTPLRKLVRAVREDAGDQNEFALLHDSINRLQYENQAMRQAVASDSEVVSQELLRRLLLEGQEIPEDELARRFADMRQGRLYLAILCAAKPNAAEAGAARFEALVRRYGVATRALCPRRRATGGEGETGGESGGCFEAYVPMNAPLALAEMSELRSALDDFLAREGFVLFLSYEYDALNRLAIAFDELSMQRQYLRVDKRAGLVAREDLIFESRVLSTLLKDSEAMRQAIVAGDGAGVARLIARDVDCLTDVSRREYREALSILNHTLNHVLLLGQLALSRFLPPERLARALEDSDVAATRALYADLFMRVTAAFAAFKQNRGDAVIEYIAEKACSPDISLTLVAERFGMNASYVSAYVRTKIGITFASYVSQLRMAEARRLLDTDLPVRQVAERVGFYNPTSFMRFFKRESGATPSEYRAGAASGGSTITQGEIS